MECRDCGTYVEWHTSKAGKRYLAVRTEWHGDFGGHRIYFPAHRCTPNPAWRAAREQQKREAVAQAQAAGIIQPGVLVEVVKGRKIAKGVRAEVAWAGEGHYGPSVALLIDGQRVFTSLTNVQVVPVSELVATV